MIRAAYGDLRMKGIIWRYMSVYREYSKWLLDGLMSISAGLSPRLRWCSAAPRLVVHHYQSAPISKVQVDSAHIRTPPPADGLSIDALRLPIVFGVPIAVCSHKGDAFRQDLGDVSLFTLGSVFQGQRLALPNSTV